MNYQKPVAIMNDDISEGIYAASGCYTVMTRIHQKPETGRGDYRIQVDASHSANHTCSKQVLTLMFNKPVVYVSSCGKATQQNGRIIQIEYNYWNNEIDNIGFGDVVVTADEGLLVVNSSLSDNG